MELGLKGKTAVVTGGSKGIGYATAEQFLREGANVYICSRNEQELGLAIKNLSKIGNVSGVAVDMTEEQSAYIVAENAYKEFKSIDCWINNVGASIKKNGSEYTERDLNEITKVCFFSTVFGTQAAFRYMRDIGGSIVNVSSLAARCGTVGASTLYGPLKSAVVRLAVSYAGEYAAYGIRVNAIMPGFTLTPAVKNTISNEYLDRNAKDTLLRRIADPAEIAGPIVFLCGQQASYITGSCLEVSGGRSIVLNPEYSYVMKEKDYEKDN